MAWVIFDNFMLQQHNGNAVNLDAAGDTLKCMLIDDTRAPQQANDANMVDIQANEVSGTGYTANGANIVNQSVGLASNTVTFDANDITWSQDANGFSNARYAVNYKLGANMAASQPICYADLGANKGNVLGDLTLEMNANGIIQITNS